MSRAGRTLRGLVKQYLRTWGQSALTVQHHVPISRPTIVAVMACLFSRLLPSVPIVAQVMLCAMFSFANSRGPRLGELCGEDHYRRANCVWVDGRIIVGSTAEASTRGLLRKGLLLRAQNPPSKTDRSGAKYGGKFMWYRYDPDDPLNFATAWAAYELRCPCPPASREAWPAFSYDGGSKKLSEHTARLLPLV